MPPDGSVSTERRKVLQRKYLSHGLLVEAAESAVAVACDEQVIECDEPDDPIQTAYKEKHPNRISRNPRDNDGPLSLGVNKDQGAATQYSTREHEPLKPAQMPQDDESPEYQSATLPKSTDRSHIKEAAPM